jgi:hypothetical protein
MTLSAFEQALSDFGSVASFLGLIASGFAWAAATGAKKAAKAAANAVRVRNLAHSFSQWAIDARDLLKAVRELHFENAQRAGIDLLGAVAHNQGWQAGLRKEAAGLEEIVRLLNLVNTYLSDETVFIKRQSSLAENCQTVYRRLSELAGHIDAQAEEL